MAESFLASFECIPRGRLFLGMSAVVLLLQFVAIVSARRRFRAPGAEPTGRMSRLELFAGLAILLLPILAATSVHTARAMMLAGIAGTDPSEKAAAISCAISGQFNAIPFAISTTTLAVALWLAARAAARPRERVSPVALIGLGMAAILAGVLQWSLHLIRAFAALAESPPEEKPALLLGALDFAGSHLHLFSRISSLTIVGLSVVAAVLTLFERRAPAETSAARRTLGISLGASLLAVMLVLSARPWRAENDLPWPPPARGDNLRAVTPVTPDLEGPDDVERAPVIQVFSEDLALDGSLTSATELGSKLGTLRNYFALLRPGERFNQVAIIVADRRLPMARVLSILKIVHDAGFARPMLVFTRAEQVSRPTFGPMARVRATAASLALFDELDRDFELEDDKAERLSWTLVRLEGFADYDAWAKRVVELRRQGKRVAVDLGQ